MKTHPPLLNLKLHVMDTVVPITESEIRAVLAAHLRRAGDIDDNIIDQAYRAVIEENRRVQRAASQVSDPEAQLEQAYIVIEAILFEQGILDGIRRFGDPLASWLMADDDDEDEIDDDVIEDDDYEYEEDKDSYWDIEKQYED